VDNAEKLFLTLFSLIAIVGIGYWLWDGVRKQAPKILIISIALIFAGEFRNIMDSVFYGLIFEDSYRPGSKYISGSWRTWNTLPSESCGYVLILVFQSGVQCRGLFNKYKGYDPDIVQQESISKEREKTYSSYLY